MSRAEEKLIEAMENAIKLARQRDRYRAALQAIVAIGRNEEVATAEDARSMWRVAVKTLEEGPTP